MNNQYRGQAAFNRSPRANRNQQPEFNYDDAIAEAMQEAAAEKDDFGGKVKYDQYGQEVPYAYFNLKAMCEDDVARSVGRKGLPLYYSRAIDRAIIESMFNDDGTRTGVDANDILHELIGTIEIANGNAPAAKPTFIRKFSAKQEVEPEQAPLDAEWNDELEPEEPTSRPVRKPRTPRTAK